MSSFLPTFQSAQAQPTGNEQAQYQGYYSQAAKRRTEQARALATGDLYLRDLLYFFELRLPPAAGSKVQTSYFFPLILNPESLQMSEPFAVEVAMTQGGGLFVEENGIVQRSLRIRGNPGWQPKNFPKAMKGDTGAWALNKQKTYSRNIRPDIAANALSGMRHLQYLQDCVFRTYADMKANPATAAGTTLIWHDVKLEEHWIAVPRSFSVEQSADRPLSYTYDIDLLLVGKADASTQLYENDRAVLQELKQPQQTAQVFADKALGSLQDLTVVAPSVLAKISQSITGATAAVQAATAIESQLKSAVLGFGVIVGNANSLIAAASDFVSGATALIESPFSIVKQTIDALETGLDFYRTLQASGASIAAIPDALLQAMRQLGDSLDLLGLHPESFRASAQQTLQQVTYAQNLGTANTEAALAAAANNPGPQTYDAVNNVGTGLMPGDAARARAETTLGSSVADYTGAQKYVVTQGDTLVSIAAKFLGDARLWQYIAVANGLKPPFVNTTATTPAGYVGANALAGALTVGASLLIPNYSSPPEEQVDLPVLGVVSSEPADVHLLGRDMLLAAAGSTGASYSGSSNALLDLVVDTAHGSTDFLSVAGVPNLAQGLTTRVLTERGTDILYQDLGMQRVIGLGVTDIDLENLRFRAQEALANDPRVASVQRVDFKATSGSPDAIVIDVTVQVRGFTQASNIQITA